MTKDNIEVKQTTTDRRIIGLICDVETVDFMNEYDREHLVSRVDTVAREYKGHPDEDEVVILPEDNCEWINVQKTTIPVIASVWTRSEGRHIPAGTDVIYAGPCDDVGRETAVEIGGLLGFEKVRKGKVVSHPSNDGYGDPTLDGLLVDFEGITTDTGKPVEVYPEEIYINGLPPYLREVTRT